MMNHTTPAANDALRIAMRYAKLNKETTVCTGLSFADGLYEITLRTPYQTYEFYVDSADGEVLGINAEPGLDLDNFYEGADQDSIFPIAA